MRTSIQQITALLSLISQHLTASLTTGGKGGSYQTSDRFNPTHQLKEVNSMTGRRGEHITRPQAPAERITITLIPKAGSRLQQLQERTNLSKTDLANRAITSYEFLDAQLRAGCDLIVRDNSTGASQIVRFL